MARKIRKYTEYYRVRYVAYDSVKATPAYKKQLLQKIDYTLSFRKTITKTQKNIIRNIKNAKNANTIVKNLEKLWETDYGLFKKQKSEPGIGFIGRKSKSKIEQDRAIRNNSFLDFMDEQNLNNEVQVLQYLKSEYRDDVRKIFEEYDIYERVDANYYPDRSRRAEERIQGDIRALADLSLDDMLFIAFS